MFKVKKQDRKIILNQGVKYVNWFEPVLHPLLLPQLLICMLDHRIRIRNFFLLQVSFTDIYIIQAGCSLIYVAFLDLAS